MHPLDNAAWYALNGPQATLAQRLAHAARYAPDVAPFAALPDVPTPEAWADLRTLVGPGQGTALFRGDIDVGPGWETMFRGVGVQMVAPDGLRAAPGAATPRPAPLTLGPDDVDDMLELVERTRPGPFLRRTVALGSYLGYRRNGRLVAMAGERMRIDGYTELSAVCTDPDLRGEGLATALIRELAGRIGERGEIPFLHVASGNDSARSLYETLGFTVRRTVDFAGVRAPR